MKWRIFKIFLFLTLVPGSVAVLVYQLNQKGFFNLQKVEFEIDQEVAVEKNFLDPLVQNLSESLNEYKGESLIDINFKKVFAKIESQAWIERVLLSREWPSTLKVKIVPKEVKFLQMLSGGKARVILADGKTQETLNLKQTPDATLLLGNQFQNDLPLRQKAIQLLNDLPDSGVLAKENVSEVGYDSKDGFWISIVQKNMQIKMGDDQFALKSARVSQVIDYLDSREIKARVIDANLSQKVLVRLRKDP